jgi:hypothetical protein
VIDIVVGCKLSTIKVPVLVPFEFPLQVIVVAGEPANIWVEVSDVVPDVFVNDPDTPAPELQALPIGSDVVSTD